MKVSNCSRNINWVKIMIEKSPTVSKANALRELQSVTGEELSALLPSVLDRAFKGEW